jgi:hypothetical protein
MCVIRFFPVFEYGFLAFLLKTLCANKLRIGVSHIVFVSELMCPSGASGITPPQFLFPPLANLKEDTLLLDLKAP